MKPYLFDEFFSSGQEESVSPFLTPQSRPWGNNLSLKSAASAAFLLTLAFGLSFINLPSSHLSLSLVYFLVGVPALWLGYLVPELAVSVLMVLAQLVTNRRVPAPTN